MQLHSPKLLRTYFMPHQLAGSDDPRIWRTLG
jgi:hypothetical protein